MLQVKEEDDDTEDLQTIAKVNALLRSHYNVNPEDLSNSEWAKLYQEYHFVKATEFKNLSTLIENASKNALIDVANQILKSMR